MATSVVTCLAAVVDVGTNSALLLIARRESDEPHKVAEVFGLARTPRLGAGLAQDGRVRPEACARLVTALNEFRERCDEHGVPPERRRVVGTAVFRRARNAAQVLAEVERQTGCRVHVLSEDEEARLGWQAVASTDCGANVSAVIDVGGGSTEVALDGGRVRCSVPVGAVVLTERWLGLAGEEPLELGGWSALLREVRTAFAAFPRGAVQRADASDPGDSAEIADVVALGGTGVNLASLELGLEVFDHRRAEGARIAPERALAWAEHLRSLTLSERRRLPIEADRAEILPAGLACLALAGERLAARLLRVSNRGLRFAVADALLDGGDPA